MYIRVRLVQAAARSGRWATALLVTGAVGLVGASIVASAGYAVPARPVAARSAESLALAQARAAGRPVTVDADTTATDQTTANPDGSFTLTRYVSPVRARKGSAWVPVDATLARNPDGTLSPKAVDTTLVFSGGGRTPLVSEDDRAGHSLAFSWPTALPSPTLDGASATYPDVLPGVDLTVTADTRGGFGEVLTVHNATAAANPALRNLHLGVASRGVRLAATADRTLTASDAATGATVYSAPAPLAWDSSTTPAAAQPAATGAGPRSLPDAPASSAAAGPGAGAHRTRMSVTTNGSSLNLITAASTLTGPDVHYPVYLDPSFGPGRQHWTSVAENFPNQSFYDGAVDSHARVGYDDWPGSQTPSLRTKSFFAMGDMSAVFNKYIEHAQLQLVETASSYSGAEPIDVSVSGAIGSGTTWNNQPNYGTGVTTSMPGVTSGNVGVNVDVTTGVRYGVDTVNASTLTFAVYAHNEYDDYAYRYFANNPSLAITYWSYPGVPTNPTITVGAATLPCSTNSASPTWVSKTDSGTIALNVSATTPDVGYPLWADYYLGANGATPTAYPTESPHNTAQSGNNTLTLTGYPVTDGYTYAWYSHASNGRVASGFNATCYFRVDATSPTTNTPGSTDFPAQGGGKLAGQSGSFTLGGTDPGTNPSGINHYAYEFGSSFTLATAAKATVVGSVAASPTDRWMLNDATCASTGNDSTGVHPGLVSGGVTCGTTVTDSQGVGRSAFGFNGTNGALATSSSVVNTAGSYSISAWVDLTSNASWNTAVAQAGAHASGFYLQYSASDNRWAMALNNVDSATPTAVRALSTAPPQLGTWTHLVGTYDAATGTATLYVNGTAQGTAKDTTPFATTGSFLIGRCQYNSGPSDYFHGAISDVQAYPRVLTAAEVSAVYSTTTLSLTPPTWGTNTLWSATVDDAGNVGTPAAYSFFAPAPPYTAGTTGDITGDGKADLVAVDKAGNLRLYPDPQPGNTGPGSTSADPLQYGGQIMMPGTANPLWQQATFAGALVTHGGSFIGKNADDLIILQNGTLAVETNTNATGTAWTNYSGLTKPGCTVPSGFTMGTCAGAGYVGNGTDWSSVKQLLDLPPSSAAGRPGLITIEEHQGVWGLYGYPPTSTGIGFGAATLLATSTGAWDWGRMTLVYAGDANADSKADLIVCEDTGNLGFFSNILAGVNVDPYTARVLVANTGAAYTADNYPYVASDQAVYNGGANPMLWAVAKDGTLTGVPVTKAATPSLGTPTVVAGAGWGNNLVAVENSYAPADNVSTHNTGSTFTAAASFDSNGGGYLAQNLRNQFTAGSGVSLYTDLTGTTTATGLSPDTVISTSGGYVLSWPGQATAAPDNFWAKGQTIPAPLDQSVSPGTSGKPATSLCFLGAATGVVAGVTGTATITWSDGTSQTITISLSDWILGNPGGGTNQPLNAGNQIVGSTPGRAIWNGTVDSATAYVVADVVPLPLPPKYNAVTNPNIQLASITLPTTATGGIHIFGVAAQ